MESEDWNWEDERISGDEGELVSEDSGTEKDFTEKDASTEAEVKKERKPSKRFSSKITPEKLLSQTNGFKYLRTQFCNLQRSLINGNMIMQFYDEWSHYLQPKYQTLDVVKEVEHICRSNTMRSYYAKIVSMASEGQLGTFDEEVQYQIKLDNANNVENTETALSPEMLQQIERNKFEAQQRLLSRLSNSA